MQPNRLRDLIADAHQRIQRRHGFLKHNADVPAPNAAQFGLRFAGQRLAAQAYRAAEAGRSRAIAA
jgi:hypothetical protein